MKRGARRSQRRRAHIKTLSGAQIKAQLRAQSQARKERRQLTNAKAARDTYKPRKRDRGKLVMIGTAGQKDPQAKGRKGYLIYVTKTGKKWLVRQHGAREPFRARRIKEIEPPGTRTFRKAARDFQRARRVTVKEGKAVSKGSGKVSGGGAFDFNDAMVDKMARSLKRTIESQASKRRFLLVAMVLVRLPDGTHQTFQVEVPIDKPDHISIEIGGLRNFVRQKFYAFMARELAFSGYVTSGSSNHIRRLGDNKGADRSEWVDRRGQPWVGRDLDTVTIERIDWRIEQIQ